MVDLAMLFSHHVRIRTPCQNSPAGIVCTFIQYVLESSLEFDILELAILCFYGNLGVLLLARKIGWLWCTLYIVYFFYSVSQPYESFCKLSSVLSHKTEDTHSMLEEIVRAN